MRRNVLDIIKASIEPSAREIGMTIHAIEVWDFRRNLEAVLCNDNGKTGELISVNLPISLGEYEYHGAEIDPIVAEFKRKIREREFVVKERL